MKLTFTQVFALALLSLSLLRSSKSFVGLIDRLKIAAATSARIRTVHVLLGWIVILPEFFCSTKAVDFVVLLAKV